MEKKSDKLIITFSKFFPTYCATSQFMLSLPGFGDVGQSAGAIGFQQPGPSQGYQAPSQPGPGAYQPPPSAYQPGGTSAYSANNLNLPGTENRSPQETPGAHAPPSTPQEPNTGVKPVPASQTTYTTDWTPPKNASK